MNRSTPEVIAPLEVDVPEELTEEVSPAWVSDLLVLTKARLSLLVLITTFVGFCMASTEKLDWLLLLNALIGTALVAGGAAALNQYMEANVDRLMERTRNRPLPSGRMKPGSALAFGIGTGLAGFVYLLFTANLLSAYLAGATLIIYLLLYTPLKRKTSFCTVVGAVSGAIPPVIGWAAAKPSLESGAWVLFGVLFLWQMPHFLAIAWMYRDEYAQAGFVMLRKNDFAGLKTAWQSLLFTVALVVVTFIPVLLARATVVYAAGASLFDIAILACAIQFVINRTRPSARRLFFASIIYLPALLGLMVFTKA